MCLCCCAAHFIISMALQSWMNSSPVIPPTSPSKPAATGRTVPSIRLGRLASSDDVSSSMEAEAPARPRSADTGAEQRSPPASSQVRGPPRAGVSATPSDPTATAADVSTTTVDFRARRTAGDSAAHVREMRRRQILVDAFNKQDAGVALRLDSAFARRSTRPCAAEQRLLADLVETRRQFDVISANRVQRDREVFEQKRDVLRHALDAEARAAAEMLERFQSDVRETMRDRGQLLEAAEQLRAANVVSLCATIVDDLVELATRTTQYKELTENSMPASLTREWTTLFDTGLLTSESSADPAVLTPVCRRAHHGEFIRGCVPRKGSEGEADSGKDRERKRHRGGSADERYNVLADQCDQIESRLSSVTLSTVRTRFLALSTAPARGLAFPPALTTDLASTTQRGSQASSLFCSRRLNSHCISVLPSGLGPALCAEARGCAGREGA